MEKWSFEACCLSRSVCSGGAIFFSPSSIYQTQNNRSSVFM